VIRIELLEGGAGCGGEADDGAVWQGVLVCGGLALRAAGGFPCESHARAGCQLLAVALFGRERAPRALGVSSGSVRAAFASTITRADGERRPTSLTLNASRADGAGVRGLEARLYAGPRPETR
jgi:hypothetical protein